MVDKAASDLYAPFRVICAPIPRGRGVAEDPVRRVLRFFDEETLEYLGERDDFADGA